MVNSACFPMFAHLNQFLTHNHEQSPVFPELFVVLNHPKAGFFLGFTAVQGGWTGRFNFFCTSGTKRGKTWKEHFPKRRELVSWVLNPQKGDAQIIDGTDPLFHILHIHVVGGQDSPPTTPQHCSGVPLTRGG